MELGGRPDFPRKIPKYLTENGGSGKGFETDKENIILLIDLPILISIWSKSNATF